MRRRIVVAALACSFTFRALAHEVTCEESVGILRIDGQGNVLLGQDGSPLFATAPGSVVSVDAYPAVVGWQLRIRDVAQRPATVSDVQDALLEGGARTVHGALPSVPFAIPVGGAVTSVVAQRVGSFDECIAL